jgi:hypothetical protein
MNLAKSVFDEEMKLLDGTRAYLINSLTAAVNRRGSRVAYDPAASYKLNKFKESYLSRKVDGKG